jgi:hypothetical protein
MNEFLLAWPSLVVISKYQKGERLSHVVADAPFQQTSPTAAL